MLLVTMAKNTASIYFDSGEMNHAAYMELEGPEVIYYLFNRKDGHFQFKSGMETDKRSITANWMNVVMEAARRCDEEAKQRKAAGETEEVAEDDVELEEEAAPQATGPDFAGTREKLTALLESSFGKKARKIIEEMSKIEDEHEALVEFCDRAEKYIFVFISNKKAKAVTDEMRSIIEDEQAGWTAG